jgi:DNA (cytosine-5)-methyltransferase 1
MGVDDPRGALFREYLRLLELLHPEAFLFENVYGITGAQGGRPWQLIVESFGSAGYQLSYRILDAADYGVPQHRERLIIVGTRGKPFAFPRPTHGPDSCPIRPHFTAGAAIEDLRNEPPHGDLSVGGRYGHLLNEIPPGLNYSYFTEKLGHPHPVFAWRSKFSDFLYKADPNMPARTIKAQGGQYTGPFHWDSRRFTVGELKRLQTFPDSFSIKGKTQAAIHQIGNSVPPQLARMLAIAVLEEVFGIAPPGSVPKLSPSDRLSFRNLKRLRTDMYEDKARQAILSRAHSSADQAQLCGSRTYRASLTSGFDLVPDDRAPLFITEDLEMKEWRFLSTHYPPSGTTAFRINVSHRAGVPWALPVQRVEIVGESLAQDVFTAGWKAFERAMARDGLKADLVQLNGYYQYPPALGAQMLLEGSEPTGPWRVVSLVVEGVGVRRALTAVSLALAWGVEPKDVDDLCRFLRTLGYEVRNRNTNPQIPGGHYLIPYAFPTLSGMSVQLRKEL